MRATATILALAALALLTGCALCPAHVTVGVSTANHALTGNVTGAGGFVSATYDLK